MRGPMNENEIHKSQQFNNFHLNFCPNIIILFFIEITIFTYLAKTSQGQAEIYC